MDRLRQLELVRAIQDRGSFSAAGRAMGMSPAAVSAAIGELERWLGTKVFDRTTRRVTTTEAGEDLAQRAQAILDLLADARRIGSSDPATLTGRLRISAPVGYGTARLGSVLTDFIRRHPGVRLDIDYSYRHVDLLTERYQLAIRLGEVRDSRLTVHSLAEHRLVLCGSPTYLGAAAPIGHPDDLKTHRCLVYTRRLPASRWVFSRNGRRATVDVTGAFEANNGSLLVEAAIAGLGLTLAPDFLVEAALADGTLMLVDWEWQGPIIPLQVVTATGAEPTRPARALIDHLTAHLGAPFER